MRIEDFNNTEWYIVYEIFLDGSKSIYGMNLDKMPIMNKKQLRTVKSHLKRRGLNYEVQRVSVQLQDIIERG